MRCLGAKFSSALFWVTTFTMFLHPESFRLPARPPSVFPADGFSRLLNNWLGSGAPQLTDCCPSAPLAVQQDAHIPGRLAWEADSLSALGLLCPKEPLKGGGRGGGDSECQSSGAEVCGQLTRISVLHFLRKTKLLRGKMLDNDNMLCFCISCLRDSRHTVLSKITLFT